MAGITYLEGVPNQGNVEYLDEGPDLGGLVKGAARDLVKKPLAFAKDLGTNPVTMAKAIPYLMGASASMVPLPFAGTVLTGAGQGIRDTALTALGKKEEIPSLGQHAIELATAGLGDATAFPAINKARLGTEIGNAEKAVGIVTRPADKLPTAGNVGEVLNTLEKQIDAGTINSPQLAKEAYGITKFVEQNPHIVGKSDEITVAAARINKKAQALLNSLAPARQAPARQMARAMTVPNAVRDSFMALPKSVRYGMGFGAGGAGAGELIYTALEKALGKR